MLYRTLAPLAALALVGCLTAEKRVDPALGPGGVGAPGDIVGADALVADADALGASDAPAPDTAAPDAGTADITGPLPDTAMPDSGATDTGGPADTAAPEDVTPDVPEPVCEGFTIGAFGLDGAPGYLTFGEQAHLSATVTGTPDVSVAVSPAKMAAFFTDEGAGQGSFAVTDVDETFRTTKVTFTLTATSAGCTLERQATVKVLGNVWITESGSDVVEIFRSDGSWLFQGIPSSMFSNGGDPWSILELSPDRIAVGSRHQEGVEVFDLSGTHQYSFEVKNDEGARLYSVYGANTLMHHDPDGTIWVGGPREKILVYDPDGTWLETIYLGFQGPEVEGLIQLQNSHVLMFDNSSLPWQITELDVEGSEIGQFGNNSTTLKMQVYRGARLASGMLVFTGRSTVADVGHLTLLKPAGQLAKKSAPIEGWKPAYGVIPFGDGFLVSTSKPGTNETPLALFDGDLNLVTDEWTDREGSYRGLLLLGGN